MADLLKTIARADWWPIDKVILAYFAASVAVEVAYCRARKNSAQHFAVRFAAKEAVWKAVGEPKLLHRDIQVRNHANGKPEIVFPKPYAALAKRVKISLSHGRDYAVAMAIFNSH